MTMVMRMLGPWRSVSMLFFLLSFNVCNLNATIDRPDPAQPIVFPGSGDSSTIPAFPEQSAVAGDSPLHFPIDLLAGVSHACPSSSSFDHLSRSRCCPTLAAAIYAAYSAAALAGAAARSPVMPMLPEDSEACAAGVQKALKAHRIELRRPNASCDLACCFCGIRLRPFSCSGGFAVERDAAGQWVAGTGSSVARRIERDCAVPGLPGCSRCLRSLYQLEEVAAAQGGGKVATKLRHGGDCELLGMSWLLAKNHTLYLPAVTGVLRALTLSSGKDRPFSCRVAGGDMPLAVDHPISSFSSSSSTSPYSPRSILTLFFSVAVFLLPLVQSSRDRTGNRDG